MLALALGLLLAALVSAAVASDTISGKITTLADGTPLQGATVTVAGPHQPPLTQTTGADGGYSIDAAVAGPYTVGVSAKGFKSQALGGVTAGSLDPIALAPATYSPLPVFAGSAKAVRADAQTGIFYALTPLDAYRSLDYGGTWQPVTMGYDDPAGGLRILWPTVLAVGGAPGEVAIGSAHRFGSEAGGTVCFSTDYGLSWRTVGGDFCPLNSSAGLRLFWGHASAGAADVLLAVQPAADGSWNVWRADMSAAAPAFVKEPSDPFGSGSVIAVADSADGSFVGRVSAAGGLSFAPLTASGPIAFAPEEVVGLPTPLLMLRLGGAREASAPPDGALVVGGSPPYRAVMLTKDAGATSFAGASRSLATDLPDTAYLEFGPAGGSGALMPTTTGTSGAGNAGSCWLQKSGSGVALTILEPWRGIAEGGDIAYDAGYGQAGNFVAINAQASLGPRKYARLDADGVPVSEDSVASAGTGAGSGGHSIRGITSPDVADTAYGPSGAGDVAVAAWQGALASRDGGKTVTEIMPREAGAPSWSAQWWQGASGEWLLFGHGFTNGKTVSALRNWNVSTTLTEPNVGGSTLAELGGPPQGYWGPGGYGVMALAPVPGTDTVFIGLGTLGEDKYGSGNHLHRARLTATDPPALADVATLDPAPAVATLYPPQALAYCPNDPSVLESMRDVLFVATGQSGGATSGSSGSLLRITGASTSSPSVAVVGSIPHDPATTALLDVRVDCARGVVYAGGSGGLYRSVDGGQTFTALTFGIGGGQFSGVTAIGLNPADPNDVTVALGLMVYHSADGGTNWILVHDAAVDRQSWVADIEIDPGTTARTIPRATDLLAAAAAPRPALVGTNNGVFDGDLAASSGLIATSAGRSAGAGVQVTTLASDGLPAMVVAPATKEPLAVFQRSNGLSLSAATGGSWSIPAAIPGTQAGDGLPSLAVARSGGLQVAFRRSAGPAPGIYLIQQAGGSWSAPQRVSTLKSDTLPALAVTGTNSTPRVHIVFTRAGRRSPGVYYASSRGGKWRVARVPGTGARDAKTSFGGPSLAADNRGRLHLTFARGPGKRAGIYYALRGSRSWGPLRRLTTVAGDRQPSLVVASNGVNQLVFSRPVGRGPKGLYLLRGASKWSLARLPGTIAADTQPKLTLTGASLQLAFSRPTGTKPGVYYDRKLGSGRWLATPQRRSTSRADAHPCISAGGAGGVTILFERR